DSGSIYVSRPCFASGRALGYQRRTGPRGPPPGRLAMRQLIAGNWKMHMLREPATELAAAVREGAQDLACDLLVCPPFTAIEPVTRTLAGSAVSVGGQDCHAVYQGAHTGDVSAAMLRDAGATSVILGHSERRQNHAETD